MTDLYKDRWTESYDRMKLEIAMLKAANESLAKEAAELKCRLTKELVRSVQFRREIRNLITRFE